MEIADVSESEAARGLTWRERYAQFMPVWAVVGELWLLLQVIEVYRHRDAGDVNLAAFCLSILGYSLWLFYGLRIIRPRDWPVIASSSVGLTLSVTLVAGLVIYR